MNIDIERLKWDAEYWDKCGAPYGATHYDNDFAYPWTKIEKGAVFYWCGNNEWIWTDSVLRGSIPRPADEWLPPVGTECEYTFGEDGPWFKCEIVSHHKLVISCPHLISDSDCGLQVVTRKIKFRPIRTEAERQREELSQIIWASGETVCIKKAREAADAILSKYNLKEK